jgi:hypothetical protein
MDLLGVINQVVQNNTEAQKLTDLSIGTVTSADPLEIQTRIDMPPLPSEVLLLTDAVKERIEDVTNSNDEVIGTVTVQHGLEAGDKVLMLRVMKGQQFIVLSKL